MRQHAIKTALSEFLRSMDTPIASERDVLELYATSHTVYGITKYRADNVASVTFEVYNPDTDERDESHPLNVLFGATSNFRDVMRYAETALSIVGRTLILPNPNVFGQFTDFTQNLIWVKPSSYTLDIDGAGELVSYRIDTAFSRRYELPAFNIPADQGIYLHLTSLFDDHDGVAPAEVAFAAAGTQRELFSTQFSYFLNRMIEAAFIQPADPGSGGDIARERAGALRKLIDRFGTGARNAGKAHVLQDRWEILNAQGDFAKLAMRELSDNARDAICEVYQFPAELLTFKASNYAQSREAVDFWREHWLHPRCEWYAGEFTRFFTQWFGAPVHIRANFDGVLHEDVDAKIRRAREKRDGAFLDLYDAALEAGVEKPDEALRGLYMIEGVPVPKAELPTYYAAKLGQAVEQQQAIPALVSTMRALLPATTSPAPRNADADVIDVEPVIDLINAAKAVVVPDEVYREIETCTRRALKGKPFEPIAIDALTVLHINALAAFARDTGHASVDRDYIINAAKTHYMRLQRAAKSAQSTRLDFELLVEDLFVDAVEGRVRKDAFRRRLMQAIRGYGELIVLDGLRAVGSTLDLVDLDDDERGEIEAHMQAQRVYVNNVAEAIYADDRVTPQEAAISKPEMWSNKSLMPLYQMGMAFGSKNAVMEWVLGRAEEHCDSCRALSGQRRRMSFWKSTVLPQSNSLQCAGYRCTCDIVLTDQPVTRGRLPRWQFPRKSEGGHDCEHGAVCAVEEINNHE